jgi:hypothetical protein
MSTCVKRYLVRAKLSKVVLATCHADVVPYLQPDVILLLSRDPSTGRTHVRLIRNPNKDVFPKVCCESLWMCACNLHVIVLCVCR